MKTFARSLKDLKLKNKRVFLRVDFNVPIKDGKIQDDRRIVEALPTINFILESGGKLIIGSHFGRPDGKPSEKLSMLPLAEYLGEKLKREVLLIDEPDSDAPKALFNGLKENQILMLENLRFLPGEENNDSALAYQWASYTDVYINDAFGVSHRAHCSVSALPKLIGQRAAGLLIEKEIKYLSELLKQPERPFGVILGGSKVSDKINIIENLIDKVDTFIIGGAMAYTFMKAEGKEVGTSKLEIDRIKFAKELMKQCERKNKKILLPIDHVIADDFKGNGLSTSGFIPETKMSLDIGPKTRKLFAEEIKNLKTILWNGPMGVFENPHFENGTKDICAAISANAGMTIVGGGDSASAAQKFGGEFTHISTGGGASLEYLEGKQLPGLQSLNLSREELAGLDRLEWVAEEFVEGESLEFDFKDDKNQKDKIGKDNFSKDKFNKDKKRF